MPQLRAYLKLFEKYEKPCNGQNRYGYRLLGVYSNMNSSEKLHTDIQNKSVIMADFTNGTVLDIMENTSSAVFMDRNVEPNLLKIVIQGALMILIFVISISANVLVFAVFYRKRTLLTISNRFIMNLAIGDFLMGLLIMPFVLVSAIGQKWIFGPELCLATGVLTTTLFAACIFTLLLISLDRYCAIMMPLHYTLRMTNARSNYLICGVWILAVGVALPPAFGWNYFEFQANKCMCTVLWRTNVHKDKYYTIFLAISCFIIPFILMLWVYVTIFKAAQRTSAKARRNSIQPEMSSDELLPRGDCSRRSSAANPGVGRRRSSIVSKTLFSFHRDDWKAAKTGLIVMSSFMVCWVPYFILILLESTLKTPKAIPGGIETMTIWLALAGCALNPTVYVFRNQGVQREIRSMFKRSKSSERREGSRNRSDSQDNQGDFVVSMKLKRSQSTANTVSARNDSWIGLHNKLLPHSHSQACNLDKHKKSHHTEHNKKLLFNDFSISKTEESIPEHATVETVIETNQNLGQPEVAEEKDNSTVTESHHDSCTESENTLPLKVNLSKNGILSNGLQIKTNSKDRVYFYIEDEHERNESPAST